MSTLLAREACTYQTIPAASKRSSSAPGRGGSEQQQQCAHSEKTPRQAGRCKGVVNADAPLRRARAV
jgi:hypothetical protein